MELLYKYQNGNVLVSIFDDGTKIQEWPDDEAPAPIYPNSMDVKITNKCNLGCKFCHEMSVPDGKHADLSDLLEILEDLPAGTELALGGGNPLEHPWLKSFLMVCQDWEFIPNLTVNGKHVEKYADLLNTLIDERLIYGLGVSIEDDFDFAIMDKIHNVSNVVYHVIAGVNDYTILDKIKDRMGKVLVLGYKDVGRGITNHSELTDVLQSEWFGHIKLYIHRLHMSFDNLAVKQLDIKSYLSPEEWDEFYMGTDGQFTMYIDAVSQEFAVSSTSVTRYPLKGTIEEIFSKVQSEPKN
jgi:hypothetical protein